MPIFGPEYHFVTHWRVTGTPAEVYAILEDSRSLTQWWPAVYLDVKELEPGDENGVGRKVSLLTKGFLPYTLRWEFVTTDKQPYERIALVATGDFIGRGIWTIVAEGNECLVEFDWKITAEKRLLRWFSPYLRHQFSANHRWAMTRGEESLRLELRRRRRTHDQNILATIPKPPQPAPVWPWVVEVVVVFILGAIMLYYLP